MNKTADWKNDFEYWLTTNLHITRQAADLIIRHVEHYYNPAASQSPAGWVRASERIFSALRIDGLLQPTSAHNKRLFCESIDKTLALLAETPSPTEGEAVAFAEWIRDNEYVWNPSRKVWLIPWNDHTECTTQELYTLFTQSKP